MRHPEQLPTRAIPATRHGSNIRRASGTPFAGWLLALALGCAPPSDAALPVLPGARDRLSDFVPAAGLRWLVVGSPRQLATAAVLAPLREHWLTETRRQAFAHMTGVDLRQTDRALAAGFDLGTVYLADASGWVAPPERSFIERLAGSERIEQPEPGVLRVTGLAGSQPQALVRVADEWVAIAAGDPTLARVVELLARGRLERVAPALDGVALGTLPDELRRPGPLAVYVPGPLDEDWVSDASSLLANTLALALTLELASDQVVLDIVLAGHWQPESDLSRLLHAWKTLSSTSLGRELTLDRPRQPPATAGSESLLRLRTQLDGGAFAAGFARLLASEFDDLTF